MENVNCEISLNPKSTFLTLLTSVLAVLLVLISLNDSVRPNVQNGYCARCFYLCVLLLCFYLSVLLLSTNRYLQNPYTNESTVHSNFLTESAYEIPVAHKTWVLKNSLPSECLGTFFWAELFRLASGCHGYQIR